MLESVASDLITNSRLAAARQTEPGNNSDGVVVMDSMPETMRLNALRELAQLRAAFLDKHLRSEAR